MDVQQAIDFADELVFSATGRHLSDIQVGVIEGVLNRKKYGQISKELNCTENYIKGVGYELWQLLSETLGEEVSKSNLRSTLLRQGSISNSSFSVFGDGGSVIGSLNVCPTTSDNQKEKENYDFLMGAERAKEEIAKKMREMGFEDSQISQIIGKRNSDK